MKKIARIAMVVAMNFVVSSAVIAQVESISPESFAQYGQDNAFWVAEVTCSGESNKRLIQRKTDGNEWCGKDVVGNCAENKDDVARKVCSPTYSAAMASAIDEQKAAQEAEKAALVAKAAEAKAAKLEAQRKEKALAAKRRQAAEAKARAEEKKKALAAAPIKKKISIEQQLIKIEQEKLELRGEELKLKRRAVEIKALLSQQS